jgi:hypothetical protein
MPALRSSAMNIRKQFISANFPQETEKQKQKKNKKKKDVPCTARTQDTKTMSFSCP